jgi:hypothetical protein
MSTRDDHALIEETRGRGRMKALSFIGILLGLVFAAGGGSLERRGVCADPGHAFRCCHRIRAGRREDRRFKRRQEDRVRALRGPFQAAVLV